VAANLDLKIAATYNEAISGRYFLRTDMIIGRQKELARLERAYTSQQAEFAVVYGRRRVGKTFLIREYFRQKACLFVHATGLQKGTLVKQLAHFAESLAQGFMPGIALKPAKSWDEAFGALNQLILNDRSERKIVVFLDELPWMATRKSGLLEALDYYWNHFWSGNPRVILVVCGSSASWLINNIIYNKGGLHNRCTCELKIDPFVLSETEDFLKSMGVKLNRSHITELYLALGGIPYYLRYVEPGLTAAENIQKILFNKTAPLKDEFKKLFMSLFNNADHYIELIKIIASKKEGVSRMDLESLSKKISTGGRLSSRLSNLVQANFIQVFTPFGKKRGEYFKLIDEFCLFYLYWLLSKKNTQLTPDYWLQQQNKPAYHAWAGYAFEAVCVKHIDAILKALNIKTAEAISSWRFMSSELGESGAQIDLLIDRSDEAITLCEIKYTSKPFNIDKSYAAMLQKKIAIFKNKTKTSKHIFLALICAGGLKESAFVKEYVDQVVILDDLF
jgi:hypothetical protein